MSTRRYPAPVSLVLRRLDSVCTTSKRSSPPTSIYLDITSRDLRIVWRKISRQIDTLIDDQPEHARVLVHALAKLLNVDGRSGQ